MVEIKERRSALRARLDTGELLAVPGAYDALSAKLVEQAGFPAVYIGSYATAAARLALPDVGIVTMSEMVAHAQSVVDAVGIPVLADAENGWNNAANIWRTVRAFEQAGACAIHIEDHEFGKHALVTPTLAAPERMVEKIRAAVEARTDPDFLIIARTDAPWATKDIDDAVERLNAYAGAGADLVMAAGLHPRDLTTVRGRIAAPVVITDTPGASVADERKSGAAIVLYYGLALHAAYHGVKAALNAFNATADADQIPHLREHIAEFEDFIGYPDFARRAKRHGLG